MNQDITRIFGLDNIDDIAAELLRLFPDAGILAFYGELGAGKTTFIKALCRCLEIEQVVTSPTFAIVNEYKDKHGSISCFHFDFYRIERVEEAMDMGYEDYFYSDNLCFIEWPEKISELLPENTIRLMIDVLDDGKRQLRVL